MELIKQKPVVKLTLTYEEFIIVRQALAIAMEQHLNDDEKFAPFHDLNYDMMQLYDALK